MKLTLLKVGLVPEPIREDFPTYPDMFRTMFAAIGADFSYDEIDVIGGEALPAPERCEAVLITGSANGVYDDASWIAALRVFLKRAYDAQVPMAGICYGHQALVDALGGVVEKSDKGWGIGRHTYAIESHADLFATQKSGFAVSCSHQDQVVSPPPGAQVIAASDFAPYAGLLYGNGRTISFQPHPEFEDDFARALAEQRRGRIPGDVVDTALASLDIPSDRLMLAKTIAYFLKQAMSARVDHEGVGSPG